MVAYLFDNFVDIDGNEVSDRPSSVFDSTQMIEHFKQKIENQPKPKSIEAITKKKNETANEITILNQNLNLVNLTPSNIQILKDLSRKITELYVQNNFAEAIYYSICGKICFNSKNFIEAIHYDQHASQIFARIGDRFNHGVTCARIGRSFTELGRFDEGLSEFTKALNIFNAGNYLREYRNTLVNISAHYYHRSNWLKAIEFSSKVEKKDDSVFLTAQIALALSFVELQQFEQSFKIYEELFHLFPKASDQLHILFSRAEAYLKLRDYPKMISDFEQAINISPDSWNKTFIEVSFSYSLLHFDRKRSLNLAENLFGQLSTIDSTVSSFPILCLRLGLVFLECSLWQKSVEMLNLGMKSLNPYPNQKMVHPTLANLFEGFARLYFAQGLFEEAEKYATKCLEMWKLISPSNYKKLKELERRLDHIKRRIKESKLPVIEPEKGFSIPPIEDVDLSTLKPIDEKLEIDVCSFLRALPREQYSELIRNLCTIDEFIGLQFNGTSTKLKILAQNEKALVGVLENLFPLFFQTSGLIDDDQSQLVKFKPSLIPIESFPHSKIWKILRSCGFSVLMQSLGTPKHMRIFLFHSNSPQMAKWIFSLFNCFEFETVHEIRIHQECGQRILDSNSQIKGTIAGFLRMQDDATKLPYILTAQHVLRHATQLDGNAPFDSSCDDTYFGDDCGVRPFYGTLPQRINQLPNCAPFRLGDSKMIPLIGDNSLKKYGVVTNQVISLSDCKLFGGKLNLGGQYGRDQVDESTEIGQRDFRPVDCVLLGTAADNLSKGGDSGGPWWVTDNNNVPHVVGTHWSYCVFLDARGNIVKPGPGEKIYVASAIFNSDVLNDFELLSPTNTTTAIPTTTTNTTPTTTTIPTTTTTPNAITSTPANVNTNINTTANINSVESDSTKRKQKKKKK